MHLFILAFRFAALLAVVFTLTGCVTRGYKLAPKDTPPPVSLNLTTAAPVDSAGAEKVEPVTVVLDSVIVYRGPGSWKREAYWDEYVVSIANRGEAPLVVPAASLHDGKNQPLAPGDHPWVLEKASKQWWESNAARQTGTYLALGAGTVAGFGAAWSAAWGTMFGGTVSSGVATAGAVGSAAVVALPLVAGGTVYMNIHRKRQVQAEFTRRRLILPLTIGPGETAHGSFFFRITPSPQRLALHGQTGEQARDFVIDLAPLANLHVMKKVSAKAEITSP